MPTHWPTLRPQPHGRDGMIQEWRRGILEALKFVFSALESKKRRENPPRRVMAGLRLTLLSFTANGSGNGHPCTIRLTSWVHSKAHTNSVAHSNAKNRVQTQSRTHIRNTRIRKLDPEMADVLGRCWIQ